MVEQAAEADAVDAVLFDGVFVVDAGNEAFVGDVQERHAGGFVDTAAFRFDDAVLDLVAHAEAVSPADAVRFQHQLDRVGVFAAIERDRHAFGEAYPHFFCCNGDVFPPKGHAHDGGDDADAAVQVFEVFGFVGGAQQVGVGGVGFFRAHFVVEAVVVQKLRHFRAAAQFVDKALVQPGFVDFQTRVGHEAVAVEALDVVALVGAAVAPDVHVVFLHCGDQHGAGDGAAERGGVEVGQAAG